MILHKLIFHYLRNKDDDGFYRVQAVDTVKWLENAGIQLDGVTTILDLGCGHGFIGSELMKRGYNVTFADEINEVTSEQSAISFLAVDLNRDDLAAIGKYDIVICSNVLEHIPRPQRLIGSMHRMLKENGVLYLSWTNWLSPWGGHDFSPFHYLGPRLGPRLYDRLIRRPRIHTPYQSLFPTSISGTLRLLNCNPSLEVIRILPRYYPELEFIARLPLVREFLTWNCVILARRPESDAIAMQQGCRND